MTETVLYTNDGRIVATVPTLPWAHPPELLVWGERFFLLREAKIGFAARYTEAAGSFFIVPQLTKANPSQPVGPPKTPPHSDVGVGSGGSKG